MIQISIGFLLICLVTLCTHLIQVFLAPVLAAHGKRLGPMLARLGGKRPRLFAMGIARYIRGPNGLLPGKPARPGTKRLWMEAASLTLPKG